MQNEELKKKSEVLLNCPFCGGEAYTYTATNIENGIKGKCWLVHCKKCGLNYPHSNKCYTETEAIESWNTRKPMERIIERLDKEGQEIYREVKEAPLSPFVPTGEKEILVRNAIRIVKEEGGIEC